MDDLMKFFYTEKQFFFYYFSCLLQTLTDLIIDGFDEEQVWAGVELQNNSRLPQWRASLASCNLQNCSLLLGDPAKKKLVARDHDNSQSLDNGMEQSDGEGNN
jgi:hypothetical protein